MTPRISIIIPTFRRPGRAMAAARSALAQDVRETFEIVVVDNDPAGSALGRLQALAHEARVPVRIVHEPRAGVANARNAALAAAQGDMIAFLDDDEIAPPGWLGELLRVQAATRADVVFGPVKTRLPEPEPPQPPLRHRAFYEDFFARDPGHAEGLIDVYYGCGCSLIRRAVLPPRDAFSADRNEIGGEDDLLFETIKTRGAAFAWAPGAWVWETPEASRLTLGYTLKRAFAFGQGPGTKAWTAPQRDTARALGWMAVGVAQTLVFGAAALFAFCARTERRAFHYRKLAEGLGKVLWFPVIKPRFYGAAMLPKVKTVAAPG
jgi:succinoglycan biosynthesis protein ExoM